MTKQFYETPTTKTLVIRFGGMLCQSPGGYNQGGGGSYGSGDTNDNGDY